MKLLFVLLAMLTTYSQSTFHTECPVEVNANAEACNAVIDTLIHQLQTDPKLLSPWAFAGTGEQTDDSKNAIYLIWKESEYNPETHYSRLLFDILVNGKPQFKDAVIESLVTDTMAGNRRDIRVDIYYSGAILKEAWGNFHVLPTSDSTANMSIDVHIKFGWFFRIFISRKVYSETIDWRVERFMQNLKMAAEGGNPTDEYWREVDKNEELKVKK